jgi:REP element-mobilizing transposase RayT
MCGREFWTDGYFVNTVSKFGDESIILKYVNEHGIEKDYAVLHRAKQLDLFSDTP